MRSSRAARRELQDAIAPKRDRWVHGNRYYYDCIKRLPRFIVEPQKPVLELRCQTGHLLAAVEPSIGVGVEISEKLAAIAQGNYPDIQIGGSKTFQKL